MSTTVDLYVHRKTGAISKTVIPQDVSATTLDISQTTLSVWLKSDSSRRTGHQRARRVCQYGRLSHTESQDTASSLIRTDCPNPRKTQQSIEKSASSCTGTKQPLQRRYGNCGFLENPNRKCARRYGKQHGQKRAVGF